MANIPEGATIKTRHFGDGEILRRNGSNMESVSIAAAGAATLPIAQADVTNLVTDLGNKQPLDAELTAIAALTSAADKVPYFTGSGTAALADFPSAARTLLAQTTDTGQRSTLDAQKTLVSGTNIKTVNGTTLLGSGDLTTPDTNTLGPDGDKGDITVGGTGTTLTIDNDAVTYAKLQDVAGFSVVGKATTGSGDAADITAADETVLGRTGAGNLAFAQVATGQIANGAVTEAKQTLADNTTNDVSITKHGYAPKAPNDTSKYLRGDGTWATVSASGDGLGTDGDKGDITVGGTGTTLTIDNDAVTFAKMQNISSGYILGRTAASSGDIEELLMTSHFDQQAGFLGIVGAEDSQAGVVFFATQAIQETGTATTFYAVTPGRQKFHPSAAKFWVYWTGNSTTILRSYNVASVADTAVGDADITLTTSFSDANWAGFVSTNETGTDGWDADSIQSSGFNARAAGTCGVLCGVMIDGGTAVGNLTDPDQWQVVGFGDQ